MGLLAVLIIPVSVIALNFTSPSAETYFKFLISHPSPVQGGLFAYFPEYGSTIVLTQMAKRTDCIVKVPLKYVLSSIDEFQLSEHLEGFDPFERIVVRLMYERFTEVRGNDYRQEYIKALPSDFAQPLLWEDKDFELLEEHNIDTDSRDRMRRYPLNSMLHHIGFVFKNVKEAPKAMLTREALIWGVLTAASRAMQATKELSTALALYNLEEDGFVFIPGMDVVNHHPFKPSKKKQNLSYFISNMQEAEPWICYRALRLQFEGAQFLGYYGDKSNYELLTGYGFAFEYNAEDVFDLKLPMTKYCLGVEDSDFCAYKVRAGHLDMRVLKNMIGSLAGIMFKDTYSLSDIEGYILSLKNSFDKKKAALNGFLGYRNLITYQLIGTPLRTLRRERLRCETDRCRLILTYCTAQRAGRYTHAQKLERELLKVFSVGIL